MDISDLFYIIDFDGYNLGFVDDFSGTCLEFDSLTDAYEVASWYCAWINGVDL